VLAGLALVAVGAFMPWQTMTYAAGGPVVTTGTSSYTAPGLQILLFAALAALAAVVRGVGDSHTRTVQLLPALLGGTVLALAVQAYRDVAPTSAWDPSRGISVVVEGGMWLVLAGSLAMALGGVATTISIARANRIRPERWEPPTDFSWVASFVAAALGFVVAVAAATILGPGRFSSNQIEAPIIVFGGWIVAGLIIDRVLRAWLRGRRDRASAARRRSELERVESHDGVRARRW
jgi:hypothetical protein